MDMSFLLGVFLVAMLLLALVTVARAARIVRQYEKGLVMRLGKFHAITSSGLAIIMPIMDDLIRVDMREQTVDLGLAQDTVGCAAIQRLFEIQLRGIIE